MARHPCRMPPGATVAPGHAPPSGIILSYSIQALRAFFGTIGVAALCALTLLSGPQAQAQTRFLEHWDPCTPSAGGLLLCYQAAAADASTPADLDPRILAHPGLWSRPATPDYDGIRTDTYYFLGYQFFILGILYVLPESVSGWSDEQKEDTTVSTWWENVRNPAWDKDEHYINYILHPYWGGAYYVRATERGFEPWEAFWYSVLLSTLFEFGAEAIFEQPSVQDLFVTPIVGAAWGHYMVKWHDATKARVLRTGQLRWRDRAVFVATDPLGASNRLVYRVLGRDTKIRVQPYLAHTRSEAPAGRAPAWGMRLQLRW